MDGVVSIDAAPGGGADHRRDRGAQVRPPGGAEPAGDLAVHHHRPQVPLAAVVVQRRLRVLEPAAARLALLFGACAGGKPEAVRARVVGMLREEFLGGEAEEVTMAPEAGTA